MAGLKIVLLKSTVKKIALEINASEKQVRKTLKKLVREKGIGFLSAPDLILTVKTRLFEEVYGQEAKTK